MARVQASMSRGLSESLDHVAALVVVLAGLLHAFSIATPWDGQPAGWLQLLGLAILAWMLDRFRTPSRAALLGWLFATAWLAGTFWWMFVAMHTYAGLDAWLAGLAVLTLAAVLALYYAAACAAFTALAPRNMFWAGCVFAALWLLAEMARGIWFTGFGWGAAGYAHVGMLGSAAKYVGAYGVSAFVALISYLIAACFQPLPIAQRARLAGAAAAIAAIMAWSPGDFTRPVSSLRVALLQGNIAQEEKFRPGTGIPDSLRWYSEQLAASTASLVVAPETAIPVLPQQLPTDYWMSLQQRFATGSQAALIGMPLGDVLNGYTNSVVGLKPDGQVQGMQASYYRYDKYHLVPFGEFIPPFFRWFTDMMNIPLGDFTRGQIGQASFEWQGQRLAPNVCYEDLFGEELASRFVDVATAPTIFVNTSNIGWFGDTVVIDQHLNISRMRALEFERPFIRATNTGSTAIVDHTGRVTYTLARHTRGVLTGEVQGRTGATPYAWWVARFWLWPLWLIAMFIVLLAIGLGESTRVRRCRELQQPPAVATGRRWLPGNHTALLGRPALLFIKHVRVESRKYICHWKTVRYLGKNLLNGERNMPAAVGTSEILHFFQAWAANPLRVASVVPSSSSLSMVITREISATTGPVIELGPGTGVFTRALLRRGVREQDIVLIESGNEFVGHLRSQFPAASILEMDAAKLRSTQIPDELMAGAVISGLPFLSMPTRKVIEVLTGAFRKLRVDGALYLFTYGYVCPIPKKLLDRLGLEATHIGGTFVNFPPAVVYRIRRHPPSPCSPSRNLAAINILNP